MAPVFRGQRHIEPQLFQGKCKSAVPDAVSAPSVRGGGHGLGGREGRRQRAVYGEPEKNCRGSHRSSNGIATNLVELIPPSDCRSSRGGRPRGGEETTGRILLAHGGRWVFWQLFLVLVGALHFELVEENRRRNNTVRNIEWAVVDVNVVAGGNKVAAHRADIKIAEDGTADKFFVAIFGPHLV